MKLICLQAGHENTQNNCNPALRGSTGAPGEIAFTVKTRNRLSEILQQKGFQVQLVDATYNCNPEAGKKDFDLFLAIHYEADVHNMGGGLIGSGDPSVDANYKESARIRDVMRSEYFKNVGIDEHEEWSNPNVTEYYMWSALTAKTPCVLIECGVGQNAHDKVILADTDRICNAIARGICKAFNVPFDAPQPAQPDPRDEKIKQLTAENDVLRTANQKMTSKLARLQPLIKQANDITNE